MTPPKPANLDVDAIYSAGTMCGRTFNGGKVVPPPAYASGEKNWIALDFQLRLSISLTQWGNWGSTKRRCPRGKARSGAGVCE